MKNFLFVISLVLISCAPEVKELKLLQGNAIGTTYSIRYLDNKDQNFESKIDQIVKEINASTSTYLPNSIISRINEGDSTVLIDHHFETVFKKSERIFLETDGDFDPTVGVLVNAWGFGPNADISAEGNKGLDSLRIKTLLKFVGFDKVKIVNGKVEKMYPEIYFDFNAIGKGYLVDKVSELFEKNDIDNYMVEIGGEIRARGKNQKGMYWKIAIENPNTDGTRSFATTIELKNESIATSGNYRKYRTSADGKKYVHTINTKTGYATESNLLSASVISEADCADVDGYATALMAMGAEKSMLFLENHPELRAFLIYTDSVGGIKTFKSSHLKY